MITRLIYIGLECSVSIEVPQDFPMTERDTHYKDDCNKTKNNSKFTCVHDFNNDRVSMCVDHHEINTPHASSSYMIAPTSHELRSGSTFVTDLLLHKHLTGITASPFIA